MLRRKKRVQPGSVNTYHQLLTVCLTCYFGLDVSILACSVHLVQFRFTQVSAKSIFINPFLKYIIYYLSTLGENN